MVPGICVFECFLEHAEEPVTSQKCQGHAAKLAQQLVPVVGGDVGMFSRYGCQDVMQAGCTVGQ